MKKIDLIHGVTGSFANIGTTGPSAPLINRQNRTDRRSNDPASVVRNDKYPIPSFFEYRMKPRDYDFL